MQFTVKPNLVVDIHISCKVKRQKIVVRDIKQNLAPISNLKMFTIQSEKSWYVEK